MYKALAPLVVFLAGAAGTAAQEPSVPAIKVEDIKAQVGDWIVLKAITDCPIVHWRAVDRGLKIAPPELALKDTRMTLATAAKAGTYRVHAVCAKGDVPSKIIEFKVIVEADDPEPGPGPQPVPPKPPVPPPPDDPLLAKLKLAFAGDPGAPADKLKWAQALSGFYTAMAKHVGNNQVATIGDLLSDYRNAIPAVLPGDAIPQTRKVAGLEVASLAGDDPERKIDLELKAKLVDLFTKLAVACGALK